MEWLSGFLSIGLRVCSSWNSLVYMSVLCLVRKPFLVLEVDVMLCWSVEAFWYERNGQSIFSLFVLCVRIVFESIHCQFTKKIRVIRV